MKKAVVLPAPPKKKSRFAPYFLLFVAFFLASIVWRSTTYTLPTPSDPPRLYANPSRQDLRQTYLKAIRNARSSIHLVMFGLSDPAILTALSEKVAEEIPLTLYYDPQGSPNLRKLFPRSAIHPVRESGLMHQKILILDNETVFIGSANFTTHSLKMHDNLVVGLVSRKVAHFLKQNPPYSYRQSHLRCMVGGQEIELWLLPDPKGHALSELKKKIRGATHTLNVALFTLTHPDLVDEIIRASKRGVDTTVILDSHSAAGASAKAAERLKSHQVRVLLSQGVQLLHHKFVYIDGQTLITGSANWTQSAFTKNSDCLLFLYHLNKEQKGFMTHLWKQVSSNAKKY